MTKFKPSCFFKVVLGMLMISALILAGCNAKPDTTDVNSSKSVEQDISNTNEALPFKGYVAPDFILEELSGNQIRLSDLYGKTVVVNFWSLDCPDCLNEMPEFDEFNKSKASDVELLMVNMDSDKSKVEEYIQNGGYGFRVLWDKKSEAAKSYLIRSTPTTIVIGKDGIVATRFEGALNREILDTLVKFEDPCLVPS